MRKQNDLVPDSLKKIEKEFKKELDVIVSQYEEQEISILELASTQISLAKSLSKSYAYVFG